MPKEAVLIKVFLSLFETTGYMSFSVVMLSETVLERFLASRSPPGVGLSLVIYIGSTY